MVQLVETILRDAQQSLIATRMRTEDMLPAMKDLDSIGFRSLEAWGGATFDSCMRYLNEDPWERLKKLSAIETPIQMLERGQNIVGYRAYSDDIVREFIRLAVKSGCRIFRIFDALNDVRNMESSIKAVKEYGAEAQGALCYTISPVHNADYFVEVAKRLKSLGCDTVCIKDMAGMISPMVAYELVDRIKRDTKLKVNLHTHSTSGMAIASCLKAIEAGADFVDTAISPFSGGTSQPPTESLVEALRGYGERDTGYDMKKLIELKRYFSKVLEKYREYYSDKSLMIDTEVFLHQIPGGMLSNLVMQLRDMKKIELYDRVLQEVPRVREDLGYPPLVTPTSQIVGTQAVMNVVSGERYKMVIKEVKDYVKGLYGKPPAEISDAIKEKILGKDWKGMIVSERPGALVPPKLKEMREEAEGKGLVKKEEDVISYALYPDIAERFLKPGEKKPNAESQSPNKGQKMEEKISGNKKAYTARIGDEVFQVEILE
jgi:pyruvate carboxylase subunit B